MNLRRILAGLLIAPALLLTACGGGSSSIADPPISSGTTSSPTTKPPQRESPEHFIRRFYDLERRMENTGHTAAYAALLKGCAPCSGLVSTVKKYYAAGGYIHWQGLTVKSIDIFTAHANGGGVSYTVRVVAQPTQYRESAGGPVKHLKGGPSSDVLTIKRTSSGYVVSARSRLAT